MAVQYMRRIIQKRAKFDIMDLNAVQVLYLCYISSFNRPSVLMISRIIANWIELTRFSKAYIGFEHFLESNSFQVLLLEF